jgi:hypothetical protein
VVFDDTAPVVVLYKVTFDPVETSEPVPDGTTAEEVEVVEGIDHVQIHPVAELSALRKEGSAGDQRVDYGGYSRDTFERSVVLCQGCFLGEMNGMCPGCGGSLSWVCMVSEEITHEQMIFSPVQFWTKCQPS